MAYKPMGEPHYRNLVVMFGNEINDQPGTKAADLDKRTLSRLHREGLIRSASGSLRPRVWALTPAGWRKAEALVNAR